MVVCCISSTSAVIYDLNRDISDSQNINQTGGTTTVPASVPLILSDTTSRVKTGSTTTSVTVEDGVEAEGTNPIDQLPELERDAEFLMSLRWLYEQWITKYQDPDAFMPENYLSRVDASKMLSVLARKVFGSNKLNTEACAYTDVSMFDDTTKWQIKDACQLGIFKSASLFNPNQGITKGQLIAVLVRMYDRKMLDENITPWYKNYVQRAWEIGLLTDRTTLWMDEVISRLDVAKLLYKLRNIYLNKDPITKDDTPLFIHIITNNGGGKLYQALIDVNMIRDDYLETLEMKLDTVTYYFGKTKIYNYGATLSNFQVYGYIYASSESITPIGVGTRRVQKWIIQEWNLIIRGEPQTTYSIVPNEEATLYIITKHE
jgi:hypothetical protein